MDKIYIIFINTDLTEGKGSMILSRDHGFFTDKDEAHKEAAKLHPYHEKDGMVEVRALHRHEGKSAKRKKEIQAQIDKLQTELRTLD